MPLLVAGTAAAPVICLSVVIATTITRPSQPRRPRSPQPQRQHQSTPEAVDAMVDPSRRHNFASYLSGLNVVLETSEELEATTPRCTVWLHATGFVRVTVRHLIGPTLVVFGYEPGRSPDEPWSLHSDFQTAEE
jgi:hypothetical protein